MKLSKALIKTSAALSPFYASLALAQTGVVEKGYKIPIIGQWQFGGGTGGKDLIGTILNLVNIVLIFAGLVAFFYLIWGGFQYITSGGDSTKAEKGRGAIVNAIIGIIIIAFSYLIINYVITAVGGLNRY